MNIVDLANDRRVVHLTRDDWGGGPLKRGRSIPLTQPERLNIHHSVMALRDYDGDGYMNGDLDDCARFMRHLQTARPDLGPEVPYSFVVFRGAREGDMVFADGRGYGWSGAHTGSVDEQGKPQNEFSYGVCYAGNFENEHVTGGMLLATRWIGGWCPRITKATRPHQSYKATACPGDNLMELLPWMQPPFNLQAEFFPKPKEPRVPQFDPAIPLLEPIVGSCKDRFSAGIYLIGNKGAVYAFEGARSFGRARCDAADIRPPTDAEAKKGTRYVVTSRDGKETRLPK